MKEAFAGILVFFITELGLAQVIQQPTAPRPPTEPERPVVSETPGGTEFPGFPALPGFPDRADQSDAAIYETEKYDLTISGAYPDGNTRNNAASTINSAQYILYSNRTINIKLVFTDGSEYIYHLRNPRAKIETSTGTFRERFDTTVQAGREFLLEQYTSELYYNSNTVTSFNLIGGNRVIVHLVFSKRE